eukprot:scaffold186789_cov22-Tisochrysis_lutea.AAC.1
MPPQYPCWHPLGIPIYPHIPHRPGPVHLPGSQPCHCGCGCAGALLPPHLTHLPGFQPCRCACRCAARHPPPLLGATGPAPRCRSDLSWRCRPSAMCRPAEPGPVHVGQGAA